MPAQAFELILDKERHDRGQLHGFLFAVAEAGDALALDEGLSVDLHVAQHRRTVADGSHRLAGVAEGFDEGDRNAILCKVPQRAVSAREEDRVEVLCTHVGEPDGVRKNRLRSLVALEARHRLGLARRVIALRIDGRLTAPGRSDGDLRARVEEHVVRRGELLEPEPGGLAGAAERVMGRENDQYFAHALSLYFSGWKMKLP